MPDDPKYTPLEKALNWAAEAQHGLKHQDRWRRVASALGADNGYKPMTETEVVGWWKHFNKNKRWTMAMNALGMGAVVDTNKKEMERYHSKLSMQGHYTVEQWRSFHESEPIICKVNGYDDLTIYDETAKCPNWWLEGEGTPTEFWSYTPETETFTKLLTGDKLTWTEEEWDTYIISAETDREYQSRSKEWREIMQAAEKTKLAAWPEDNTKWTEDQWDEYMRGCAYYEPAHTMWEKRSQEQSNMFDKKQKQTMEDAEKYPWKYAVNLGPNPVHPPHKALWFFKFEDYQEDGLPKCESLSRDLGFTVTPEIRDSIWADYYNKFERRDNPEIPVQYSWEEIENMR